MLKPPALTVAQPEDATIIKSISPASKATCAVLESVITFMFTVWILGAPPQ